VSGARILITEDEPVIRAFARLVVEDAGHQSFEAASVDEALAVGDAYFQQKCMRWLRGFREKGTILFCGHDIGAVMNLCDQAIWLDHGELVMTGGVAEVMEAYAERPTTAAV